MRDPAEIDKLNARLAIPDVARFEQGGGGFTRLILNAPAAEAQLYLYGAHVTHYQPRDQQPVLFLSEKSFYTHGRPIRGGVPIVFPWFGPRASDAQSPMHGFARLSEWEVESITSSGETVTAILTLQSSDETFAMWPHDFQMRYIVTVGPDLDLTLEVKNAAGDPFTFEQALHTYLAVEDIRQVRIAGLSGASYLDKTRDMQKLVDGDETRSFSETIDRVYLATRSKCDVDDPASRRRIEVDKEGSETTVIWNPWEPGDKPVPDLGQGDWQRFVCVETSNVKDHAVTLSARATHVMRSIIRAKQV